MKYLLIILLNLTVALTHAQTTCIPDSVAEYFQEQNDRAKLYEKQIKIKDYTIEQLNKKIYFTTKINVNISKESLVYLNYIETKTRENTFNIKESRKQIRNLTYQRNIAGGAAGGAIIGSVIPGVGTVTGAAVGGTIGFIASIFKRYK